MFSPLRRLQARYGSSCCLLFPGQGSQYVGMCKELLSGANGPGQAVTEVFQVAERVLGYDLRPLFLQGPQERLNQTVHCQPAVVVASLAGLRAAEPERCQAAAGFSVGEITALIAAESLSVEQGLHVVKVRAESMQRACQANHSTMLTVIGLRLQHLEGIIDSMKNSHPDSEVCVGNHLFPIGYVISGHTEPVKQVAKEAVQRGATVKQLRVSGAFHSRLMEPAVPELEAVLRDTDVKSPLFPVYSNVSGRAYSSVDEIRSGLTSQLTSPVLWEQAMSHMTETFLKKECQGGSEGDGTEEVKFLEVGPGRQLKSMLRRIDKDAYRSCDNITV